MAKINCFTPGCGGIEGLFTMSWYRTKKAVDTGNVIISCFYTPNASRVLLSENLIIIPSMDGTSTHIVWEGLRLRKDAISRLEKCTEFSVCVIPSIPGTCQSLYEADHNIGWRIQEAVWIVIRIRRSSALLLLIIQREHHNFVVHLSVVVVEKRFVRTRSRLLRSVGSILPKDQGVDDYGNCSPNSRTLGSNKSVSSAATANKGTGRI